MVGDWIVDERPGLLKTGDFTKIRRPESALKTSRGIPAAWAHSRTDACFAALATPHARRPR
jgi:hypothetical protein